MRAVASLASCIGLAAASCENVTWEPKAAVPFSVHNEIRHLRRHLRYNDGIAKLISEVREDVLRDHVLYLSGEGGKSTISTRASASRGMENGIDKGIEYVQTQMAGYGFETRLEEFRADWGQNVVSTLRGTTKPDEIVVMGAHLDDRRAIASSLDRAPGGNDDGSGSAALLAVAEAIHRTGATFEHTLVLEHYSGEEQGLVGSRDLAAKRRKVDERVVAMFQQDMTAVQRSGDPLGVAFVQDRRAVDDDLTKFAEEVAHMYKDSRLTVYNTVLSGSNCCSDHQSYAENGFPSVGYIEPRGYTGDPQYHTVTDTVLRDDFSTLQATLAARVVLAAAADVAGFRAMSKLNSTAH